MFYFVRRELEKGVKRRKYIDGWLMIDTASTSYIYTGQAGESFRDERMS